MSLHEWKARAKRNSKESKDGKLWRAMIAHALKEPKVTLNNRRQEVVDCPQILSGFHSPKSL